MSNPDNHQPRGKAQSGDQLALMGDLLKPTLQQVKAAHKKQQRAERGPSAVERRLIETAAARMDSPDEQALLYQHSIFCQTYFPYRDPGDDVREWERSNGNVHLEVRAGKAMHPTEHRLVKLGLPFGPKCRLLLMALNQLAVVHQSPHIEVADSLTAFVGRVLKIGTDGKSIRAVKEQLARLSASDITLGRFAVIDNEGTATRTDYIRPVQGFDLWFPKNESQRVLWPGHITMGTDYFNSLMQYAVPVDEGHVAALAHSGLALDIYAWLAHRLHRIPPGKPSRVSWPALHSQFGQGYDPTHMSKFRQVFRVALKAVLSQYSGAKVEDAPQRQPGARMIEGKVIWREAPAPGLLLHHSPPPIRKKLR